jgi:hypothetical protein
MLKNARVLIIDNFHAIFHGYQSSDPFPFEEASEALLHGAYVQYFVITGEE